MGLFSKLFRRKETIANSITDNMSFDSPECQSLWDLKVYMDTILSQNRYIAKSEYRAKLLDEKKTVEYFGVLQSSRLLDTFCKNNGLSLSVVESALSKYINFEALVDEHNDSFIRRAMSEEQHYLDNILREVDPQIKLDEDQRRVILTDEDYCLVIAGAGAGKTTTVAAKVKYLVEKKGVEPSQILVVSFTNKAVQELRDKLNRDLAIDCPIATFHSTGKRYYGINVLADVLRGANSKRITDAELDKLPEYGKLNRVRRDDLITTIEWLIENHFILKTKHPRYPVLHPTYEGMHYDETITTNKLKKLQNTLQKRSASILS